MVEMSTSGSGEGPGEVTTRGYSTSVCVTGKIEAHGRKPQIVARDPSQITVRGERQGDP
jgi:hypothetical protein